jgi:hypothetical protein
MHDPSKQNIFNQRPTLIYLSHMKKYLATAIFVAVTLFVNKPIQAAGVEMGIGVPSFGLYSTPPSGTQGVVHVWALESPQIQMRAGCSYLVLKSDYMGLESFKIAVGILTSARLANRAVQFYSHFDGGGCLVDYVRLM